MRKLHINQHLLQHLCLNQQICIVIWVFEIHNNVFPDMMFIFLEDLSIESILAATIPATQATAIFDCTVLFDFLERIMYPYGNLLCSTGSKCVLILL